LDLARVNKKLAEAQFFLSKMIEQERRIFRGGDPREPFDYYLALVTKAYWRAVDSRLCSTCAGSEGDAAE
jgi:hypothetical protein